MEKNKLIIFSVWGQVNNKSTLSGLPYYLINELSQITDLIIIDNKLFEFRYSIKNKIIYKFLRSIDLLLFKNINFKGAKLSWSYFCSLQLNYIINKYPDYPVLSFGIAPFVFSKRKYSGKLFSYIDGSYSYKCETYLWLKNKISISEYFLYKFVERRFLKRVNKVFATSETIKQTAFKYKENCHIINISIGANTNTPQYMINKNHSILNFCFVFTDYHKKGGHIIEELSNILDNCTFHMIGKIPSKPSLNKNIIWHGYIDKNNNEKQYLEILSKCHINILPSLGDLTPHVICECNALGIPTVANNVGGIKDLVGFAGEVVKGFEIQDYISAINKVAQNYSERSFLARNQFAIDQNWAIIAKRLHDEIVSVGNYTR